jgi:hypothetical protein
MDGSPLITHDNNMTIQMLQEEIDMIATWKEQALFAECKWSNKDFYTNIYC